MSSSSSSSSLSFYHPNIKSSSRPRHHDDRRAIGRQQGGKGRIDLLLSLVLITWSPMTMFACASTLVRENYRLQETNRDTSDFTFGGTSGSHSVSGSCSYVTYYDTCSSAPGERVLKSSTSKTSYIISDSTVTSCNRWRRSSSCNNCFGSSCTVTTSTTYGGETITYSLVPSTSSIASLPLSLEYSGACRSVCTSSSGKLITTSKEETCPIIKGFYVVNDDYDLSCPNKQTCEEVYVSKGCEGSYMGSVVGTYRPLDLTTTDECQYVDHKDSHSVYKKSGGTDVDVYIYYTGSQWKIHKSFCADSFTVHAAYFDAEDEPFTNPENSIQCYDGGYGSNKNWDYTDFSITCKKMGGNNGGSNGYGLDGSGPTSAAVGKFNNVIGTKIMTIVAVVMTFMIA